VSYLQNLGAIDDGIEVRVFFDDVMVDVEEEEDNEDDDEDENE